MTDPATHASVVDECVRCGYNLLGIANDQACPECGLLAERSRRISDELHESRPRWLARMSRGIWLMLLAIALPFASLPIMWTLQSYAQRPFKFNQWRTLGVPRWWAFLVEWSWFGCVLLAALCLFVGALLLTSREGYAPADRADRARRRWLRIAAFVPVLALMMQAALYHLMRWYSIRGYYDWYYSWTVAVVLLLIVGSIPLPLLLFYQLRSLARRARSAHLAEHCAIVGIGASCSLAYIAAVYLIFTYADDLGLESYWTTRSSASLVLMLLVSVSAGLFIMWALYLLIRFAIAFGKASRELRRKWQRDDRAMPESQASA